MLKSPFPTGGSMLSIYHDAQCVAREHKYTCKSREKHNNNV